MNEIAIWGIALALLICMVSILNQLRNDIARTNVTLNKIAKHLGVQDAVTEDIDDELKTLILQGENIKAIKKYRTVTGFGLKESKDYIDSLGRQLQK